MRHVHDQRIFLTLMFSLVILAWLSLGLWGQSPYGHYLHHEALEEVGIGPEAGFLLVFVGGWTLMTVAMMLPTSLPLLALFQRMTATRSDSARLVTLVVAGYLLVWAAFGFAAHLADLGLHRVVEQVTILDQNTWILGSSVLLLAGGYQFTALKYRCLEECRTPLSFIASRWSGRVAGRDSFRLGIDHGLFCVGCCWTLMLLMFLVGTGSLLWMLLLGIVMALEKNVSWGRQLSTPLGIGLLSAGSAVALMMVI
jgi:predicted metal-binding membrane protein